MLASAMAALAASIHRKWTRLATGNVWKCVITHFENVLEVYFQIHWSNALEVSFHMLSDFALHTHTHTHTHTQHKGRETYIPVHTLKHNEKHTGVTHLDI